MLPLKWLFIGFFPNGHEEPPVWTTPSVTQNYASHSWGGAGLSFREETRAVAQPGANTRLLLPCVCTRVYMRTRVCVHVCAHMCARVQASVLLLHMCIMCHLKKQVN